MKKISLLPAFAGLAAAAVTAAPALAAEEGHAFFSLHNGHLIVAISFIIVIAGMIYFKVPGMINGMLDKRIGQIRVDLEEARLLREEAQTILASYERKQKEVQAQADRIVAQAKEDAMAAAEQAKTDLAHSIERRLAAAEEQIASAEQGALREVRDRAVTVAVAAAGDVLAKQLTAEAGTALVDESIETVGARLN